MGSALRQLAAPRLDVVGDLGGSRWAIEPRRPEGEGLVEGDPVMRVRLGCQPAQQPVDRLAPTTAQERELPWRHPGPCPEAAKVADAADEIEGLVEDPLSRIEFAQLQLLLNEIEPCIHRHRWQEPLPRLRPDVPEPSLRRPDGTGRVLRDAGQIHRP